MPEYEGSCLCGGVRFEVTEPFRAISFCHCETCKRLSGGEGTVNGRTRSAAIRVLAGEELLRTFQPDEGTSKTFCSACGANLFGGGWPDSELASVRIPALATRFEQKPTVHIFMRSVAPWETVADDGAERYETRPG